MDQGQPAARAGEKGLYPLLSGIVPIVNTPFDGDGRIDFDSLARGTEDRIAAGVAGLIVPGVASEVGRLSVEERRAMVRAVVETAAGRVPVVAGASAAEVRESATMAELAADLGCAGVLIQPPGGISGDRAALGEYLSAVARTGIPMLMLQDLDWNGPGIPVPVIAALFEQVEAFRCVKIEAVPAGPKYTAVLEATGGRLHVSGGWASTQLMEALDRGVHAFMPSAHYWVYTEIVRRYRAGGRAGAQGLFERLLPILAFASQHIDVSIQFQKLLAVRQGIFRTARVRAPQVAFDAHHRALAEELIERAVALHEEVGRPSELGRP